MRSEETYGLMQSAREIQVAIDTDGDRIGGLLNEKNPLPVEEGESAFDYRLHMRSLSQQLDVAANGAAVAEDAHTDQQIRSFRVQADRDEVSARGYGKLVSTRGGLESLYRGGAYELAFLRGATPQAPRRLADQLGQTARLLRRPAVERRDLKVKGFGVDLDEVAGELEAEEKALRDALGQVDAVTKRAEGTLVAKREAIDVLRRTVVWVGRTVEGLFRLAGEDALADRIRTSTRRSLRPSGAPEEEPGSASRAPEEPAPEPRAPDSRAPDSQA